MPEPAVPASLAEALIALQSRLPRITKDDEAQVGSRTYRYANLASIHDAIFPLLAELGLTWVCCPTLMDGTFVLDYVLSHVSGDGQIQGQYPLPGTGTPQQIGSAITYARRYTLTAVLGIAPAEDDDDAQAAEDAAAWHPPANPRTRKATRVRGTSGEDTDWTTPPEKTPGSVRLGQLQKIGILFTRLGITEREDRLLAVMSMLGLPEQPETSKDLSVRQAEELLGKLEKELAKEEGQ
jgi:ERF superfamily protein